MPAALEETYLKVLGTRRFRTLQELQGFFGDLEMIEPGLVSLPEWHPAAPLDHDLSVAERLMAGGIARKR